MLIGIAVAYAAALFLPWPWALACSALVAVRRRTRRFDLGRWLPCVVAIVLGAIDRIPPQRFDAAANTSLCGWIASRPERSGTRWRALLALDRTPRRRLVLWSRSAPPPYGTCVRVQGVLRPPHPARHFHARGEALGLAASGAAAIVDVQRFELLPGVRGTTARRAVLEPLRSSVQRAYATHLAPREAALLAALVVGIRDDVDARTQDSWRELGLAHILSISGMHVALVAGALLGWLGVPRTLPRVLILLAGIWLYAGLGGLGPTVLRAACMATWAAVATWLGRAPRGVVGLGIAALALAMQAPERRFDLGFQLSCLATFGLVVWASPLVHVRRSLAGRGRTGTWSGALVVACGASIAAQIATLPLQLAQFGMVSWAAPILNLIAVPLTDAALGLGLVAAPLFGVSAWCGRGLALAAGGLLHLALRLTDAAHAAIGGCVWLPVDAFTVAVATVLSVTLLGAGLALAKPLRRLAHALLAMTVLCCATLAVRALHPSEPAWQFEALDVGQGDALLLRVRSRAWLVDAGDRRPADRGARVVLPHLRRAGVRRLHGLVLSHPHADHIGGAISILGAMPVDTLYVASISVADSAYAAIAAAAPQVPVRALRAGARLALGHDYVADVLWPDAAIAAAFATNDRSLVLRAHGGALPEVLLLGDLERAGEGELLRREVLCGPPTGFLVLKVGHHGSDTSTSTALLARLQPDVGVVSVGKGNRYGHPAVTTLDALVAMHCTVLRTDRGGAIRIVLRGATLWIERPDAPARIAGSLARPG